MSGTKYRAITPKALMMLYAGENGGPVATRDLLAYHLREGHIRTRVMQTWESNEPMLLQAWKQRPDDPAPAEPSKNPSSINVLRSVWWKSADWSADKENWDFKNGRFVVTLDPRRHRRIMLRRVRFHGGDIKACFGSKSLDAIKRPGPVLARDQWRMFWHEIIHLIQENKTDFGLLGTAKYASNEKLRNKVVDSLRQRPTPEDPQYDQSTRESIKNRMAFTLADSTIDEEVKKLRHEFRLSRGTS